MKEGVYAIRVAGKYIHKIPNCVFSNFFELQLLDSKYIK